MYQAFVNVAGDIDIAGKLRANLAKKAVIEGYDGLSLAIAQRQAAEGNLRAAQEFEHITSLLMSGGEVAPVDLTRAQLQTLKRRDELEQALANEQIAADFTCGGLGRFPSPVAS